jgi:serine/threonine-protein kinase
MSDASFLRLKQVFNHLVDLPRDERAQYLDAQDDIDADTRQQLQDLLSADANHAHATARRALRSDRGQNEELELTGRRIGAFQILREIGRGGMGSVFLAERVDGSVVQQVAIKVVRPERLAAGTLGRFRLERQLLALLQHRNIPKMLDLGELPDGSPYVVMEYVAGEPIDRHARANRLSVNQRLHLFLHVCDAVAYAHRNLIVHRDIKPANVLVDAQGQPQLLDFGIAKPLLGQIGAVDVVETGLAERFLSPIYAAPEQLRGDAITTACDTYALGVLLYELLAGTPPFTFDGLTPAQLERKICEDDPVPPSQRAVADDERSTGLRIRPDLDLIVLRCLRKDAADRYSSVDQLAEDVRHFQHGMPVRARQGNLWYRASRFAARHRTALALSTLVLAVAVAGGVLLWRQQLATATQQARADEMTGLITDALQSVDPSSRDTRDMSAREMFERVAAQAQSDPAISAQSRARILATVARVVFNLGQTSSAEKLLAGVDARELDRDQRREVEQIRARILIGLARYDEAMALIERGLAAERPRDVPHRAHWQALLARAYYKQGKSQLALDTIDALPRDEIAAEVWDSASQVRSMALWGLDRRDEAIAETTRLIAAQRVRLGNDSPAVYDNLRTRAILQSYTGNLAEMEALSTELIQLAEHTYGRNSMHYANAVDLLRIVAVERGDMAKAVQYEEQILAIYIDQAGPSSEEAAKTHLNLASMYEDLQQVEKAHGHYQRAHDIAQIIWRSDDTNLLLFRTAFATFLALNDRSDELQPVMQAAMRDIAANPPLELRDLTALLRAADAADKFRRDQSTANRQALSQALKAASEGCKEDPEVWKAFNKVLVKARSLGVGPAA